MSGTPACFVLRPPWGMSRVRVPQAVLALARRGMPRLRAQRAIEEMAERGRAWVALPEVDDARAVLRDLTGAGIAARLVTPPGEADARAVRGRLGLTQEQFALRYGLDLAALRNWEHGRTKPGAAVRSYLRLIEREPEWVAAVLAEG